VVGLDLIEDWRVNGVFDEAGASKLMDFDGEPSNARGFEMRRMVFR
jgi:hypothetical protein